MEGTNQEGPPAEEEIKQDEVRQLIENDVVEEANGPYCSNLVVVRK